eukprot:6003255-Lingulodinium_polyedra.AAC.1
MAMVIAGGLPPERSLVLRPKAFAMQLRRGRGDNLAPPALRRLCSCLATRPERNMLTQRCKRSAA